MVVIETGEGFKQRANTGGESSLIPGIRSNVEATGGTEMKEEDCDWPVELARMTASDVIQAMSKPQAFPCDQVNKMMSKLWGLLENEGEGDCRVEVSKNDFLFRHEVRYQPLNEPSIDVLIVPVGFGSLKNLKEKDMKVELLTSLVGAASRTVDQGEREDWALSRVIKAKKVLETKDGVGLSKIMKAIEKKGKQGLA